MNTCWLDFWTSNSTISYKDEFWKVHLIQLWKNKPETRTVLFWDNDEQKAIIGDLWIHRFIEGHSGRLIQSPKSFLNSKEEVETIFWGRVRTLWDIITSIITHFRNTVSITIWNEVEYVRLWRPVKFHDTDTLLDKKAQDRLEQYAKNAGFKWVEFELEPVAAAKTFENSRLFEWELLLVADFWWGTSDFSIIGYSGDWKDAKILANDGVYVAWNSFDQQLSLKYFSQFLWNGTQFKSGDKLLSIPSQPYFLLSDWKLIHQLNDRKMKQSILDIRWALDQDAIDRLIEVTNNPELGYEYFRMVEQAKIVSSTQDPVVWNVNFFKKTFDYMLTWEVFRRITQEQVEKIKNALRNSLQLAWVKPEQIWKILLVWWTGQLRVIQEMLESEIWIWKIIEWDTFNAIGKGLSMD